MYPFIHSNTMLYGFLKIWSYGSRYNSLCLFQRQTNIMNPISLWCKIYCCIFITYKNFVMGPIWVPPFTYGRKKFDSNLLILQHVKFSWQTLILSFAISQWMSSSLFLCFWCISHFPDFYSTGIKVKMTIIHDL
jgi:hypothetical protein